MRLFARLLYHPRPEPEWLPLPYEQAILMPDPVFRDFGQVLTADGRIAVLVKEPPVGQPKLIGVSRDLVWAGYEVRKMRREMG